MPPKAKTPTTDPKRLKEAFAIVWQEFESRIADPGAVTSRLESLVAMIGSRHPDLNGAEIAKIAKRMFDTSADQKNAEVEEADSDDDGDDRDDNEVNLILSLKIPGGENKRK
jgi:hypothetical protein